MDRRGHRRGQSSAYPVQHVQRRPRQMLIAGLLIVTIVLTVFLHVSQVDSLYVAKGRDAYGKIQQNIPDISRPFAHLHNPFKPQARPPQVQPNSTWGDASWFSDWKWMNPFSSTVTLDEDRALLPPLDIRPPIYTYYEPRDSKEEASASLKAAEERLLEVWRRAWWAQGFRPIILGPLEAMENPLYQKLQSISAPPVLKMELMRWLAWSHMGDGILANWLLVPMAEFYQPTLTYLRSARYTELTRFLDLELGLFTGAKKDIDKALNVFLDTQRDEKKPSRTLMDIINENDESSDLFHVEAKGKGVAFYSEQKITSAYKEVAELLAADRVKGLGMLADLVTAHLHATFLAKYPDGLAVVSPYAGRATLLSHRALTLASTLNTCPLEPGASQTTPVSSCPPNRKDCSPCKEVPLRFPSSAPNSTTTFTIGTVPHAYTLTRLMAPNEPNFNFTVPYVRRRTTRDPFIEAVTSETSPKGVSSYTRILHFKEGVAQAGRGARRSIWHTAESDWDWTTLEWRLGFELQRPPADDVSDVRGNPVPQKVISWLTVDPDSYPETLAPLLGALREKPLRPDLARQARVTAEVVKHLEKKKWDGPGKVDMRRVCDSWHLADAEAWRFTRALQAREELEREKWSEEEGHYKH